MERNVDMKGGEFMDNPIARGEHEEFSKHIDSEFKRIETEIKRVEETNIAEDERQNHRITLLEETTKQNRELLSSIKELAVEMKGLRNEQEKQGKDIEALKARDGEKWRQVAGYVLTAVIGILIGFIFKQFGM